MRVDEEIHIVSVTDNRYVQHSGVAFCSLLANKAPDRDVCLHVVFQELSRVNQMRLELIADHYGAAIRFHPFEGEVYRNIRTGGDFSKASYFKMSVPVLPAMSSVRRAIYLDGDLIVTGNIAQLWETDLAGKTIGAVRQIGGAGRRKVNLPSGWPYFNAGVLLIDMDRWKEQRITDRAVQFFKQHPDMLSLHAPDALNSVLQAEWLELPAQWNWQANRIFKMKKSAEPPNIIHYSGSSKPWHYDNDHAYEGEYYKYLQMTGWRSFEPEKNRTAVMKRFTKRVLPRTAYSWFTKIKSTLMEK